MALSFKEKYLFLRLKRKDQQAFIEFYDLYVDQLYQYIFFKVGNKEDAEDLTSNLFLKLWNIVLAGEIKDYKTIKSFVYTVARNLVVDHYRRLSSQKTVALDEPLKKENSLQPEADKLRTIADKLEDEKQDIAKEVDRTIDLALIKKKLFDLKDEYREIIVLRFLEEMSVSETAQILGKKKANVRVLTHRALKALRELLES